MRLTQRMPLTLQRSVVRYRLRGLGALFLRNVLTPVSSRISDYRPVCRMPQQQQELNDARPSTLVSCPREGSQSQAHAGVALTALALSAGSRMSSTVATSTSPTTSFAASAMPSFVTWLDAVSPVITMR